ncbi:gasdermin [Aquimarina rhabdastrellae]
MNLTKTLRNQGYDLIGGPIRNQKLLQLWLKRPFSDIELYYSSIDHAFKSDVTLDKIENDALNVNATMKNEYKFNLGITLLEELLKSLGLGTFEVSSEIKSGKKVTISYDNSKTIEVPIGEIQTYLSDADFNHANRALLKNANRNNIIVISGILSAKNLVVEIETDFTLNADLTAKLNGIADGKLNFAIDNDHTLKMVSNTNNYFPIAVKADKIDFDNGHFDNTQLITDRRNLF